MSCEGEIGTLVDATVCEAFALHEQKICHHWQQWCLSWQQDEIQEVKSVIVSMFGAGPLRRETVEEPWHGYGL